MGIFLRLRSEIPPTPQSLKAFGGRGTFDLETRKSESVKSAFFLSIAFSRPVRFEISLVPLLIYELRSGRYKRPFFSPEARNPCEIRPTFSHIFPLWDSIVPLVYWRTSLEVERSARAIKSHFLWPLGRPQSKRQQKGQSRR